MILKKTENDLKGLRLKFGQHTNEETLACQKVEKNKQKSQHFVKTKRRFVKTGKKEKREKQK